ncbi:MAG: MBL fold metallo-hydrolase [Thermodesulfobacteriota bacterium]|nr:MBL fold metallo-hydrolase [Thermodesulfobacteriota bacterium]
MECQFLGGAGEVTGSMHLLNTGRDQILMDCGMFQGRRRESNEKNRYLPVDPSKITNMVLSHAHIDHSGRIPMLTQAGFSGRVITTRPTQNALSYMLLDSGHIQENDAHYLNYKSLRAFLYEEEHKKKSQQLTNKEKTKIKQLLKKSPYELDTEAILKLKNQYGLDAITPLYTQEQARQSLTYIDGYPFKHEIPIGRDTTVKFYVAGHILGSAFSVLTVKDKGRLRKILFTGDVGRFNKPILKDPTLTFDKEDTQIDLMIMESTYGDREHGPVADLEDSLKKVLLETHERGGALIIPAFAYGRTQELIYVFHKLYESGQVPRLPIYVDSPLASNLTRVFGEHPETYDKETHAAFLEKGLNPFYFDKITFVQTVEESMALTQDDTPHVVISASGMCEAGRILHHLRYNIHNPKNTILIVGYMAQHTLGRRIEELGAQAVQSPGSSLPDVKILGKSYPLAARVKKLEGFSAHADKHELNRLVTESHLEIGKIAVVHGEESQSKAFAAHLKENGYDAFIPAAGDVVSF